MAFSSGITIGGIDSISKCCSDVPFTMTPNGSRYGRTEPAHLVGRTDPPAGSAAEGSGAPAFQSGNAVFERHHSFIERGDVLQGLIRASTNSIRAPTASARSVIRASIASRCCFSSPSMCSHCSEIRRPDRACPAPQTCRTGIFRHMTTVRRVSARPSCCGDGTRAEIDQLRDLINQTGTAFFRDGDGNPASASLLLPGVSTTHG
jgi:hypothetical protein